jgi:hypothetical protein
MGNANSQMLENIVQGSNCEFFFTNEPSLQPHKKHTDRNETVH